MAPGETLGIVGESGCGKSVTALSIMQLLPRKSGRVVGGTIRFDGRDLLGLAEAEMRQIRGNQIAMIFQEPMTSLNPLHTIGEQIAEAVRIHQGLPTGAALARATEMLRLVRIPDPERRLGDYPHQFSGGMRQRVMIAMALACSPKLLIADEPTTALDVTIQAQILRLMLELKSRIGAAIILITHDLGVVAETCQRVIVMYAGPHGGGGRRIRPVRSPGAPLHARAARRDAGTRDDDGAGGSRKSPASCHRCASRSRAALRAALRAGDRSLPRGGAADAATRPRPPGRMLACRRDGGMSDTAPVLTVEKLVKRFPIERGFLRRTVAEVRAVDDVSFSVGTGETLCIVGESGCGKTTVAKLILRLIEPTAGRIVIEGHDITSLDANAVRQYRRRAQMVFQDPYSSLNPRLTAAQIVTEPIENYQRSRRR